MTSVLRCAKCGFDAAPEHFRGNLCSMCATPVSLKKAEARDPRKPYGPMVLCRCGCGAKFHQFDARGRVKWFSGPGHYNRGTVKRSATGRFS